jgi:hypothetical protein
MEQSLYVLGLSTCPSEDQYMEGCSSELQMEKKGDGNLDEAILDDNSISCILEAL